ncbi:MAG: PAS domain S-box protein [Thermoplasmatota archaeon]
MDEQIRVMLADDNPDDRTLVIRELKKEFNDISVDEIRNQEELDEAFEKDDYDIVITDYRLRWTTGIDILKEVKKRWKDCPVVMFTGTGNEEVAVQAMKAGLDDYVVKSPKHFVRLTATVRSVLEKKRIKEEKKEAQDLYKRLFNDVPIGLYSVDREGNIIAVNDAMVEMMNYPDKKDLLGVNARDTYVDDKDRESYITNLKQNGYIKDFETRVITYDGGEIWVNNNARAIKDEEGKISYIEGSMKDITERKEVEEKLKNNKKKIKNLHSLPEKLLNSETKEEVYEITNQAVHDILDFDQSTLLIKDDGHIVVEKTTDPRLKVGTELSLNEGIYGKTFTNKESYLINDITKDKDAEPLRKEFRSVLSVPIGDIGVLQIISDEVDYFDQEDLEMAEILASHAYEAYSRIKYQEEILEKERKYKSIFENTGTAMMIVEEDTMISMVNDEFENITGYHKDEVEGKMTWTSFVTDEDVDRMKRMHKIRRKNPEGAPHRYEFQFKTKSDEVKNGLITVDMIPDSTQSIVSVMDITERKQAENKLKGSEEKYKTIFENTGTATVMIEPDMTISMVNRETEKITGYSREEIEGKIKWSDFVVEEDLPRMKEYHEKRREEGNIPETYTFTMINRFGDTKEMFITVSTVQSTDKTIASLIDISKYKEIKQTLLETQEMFRTAFDYSDIGMALIDPEGVFTAVNDAFSSIFGHQESDLTGNDIRMMVDGDSLEKFDEMMDTIKSGESAVARDQIGIKDDKGDVKKVLINLNSISDTDGELIKILTHLKEID